MMKKPAPDRDRPANVVFAAVLSLMLIFSLTSCGLDSTTADEHLVRGKQYFADGEYQAAVIEYKNAVQKDPRNIEARLLLGEYYVFLGLSSAAEKEALKAMEVGGKTERSVSVFVNALLGQREYQRVVDEVVESGLSSSARLLSVLGEAYIGLKNREEALNSFNAAEKMRPGFPAAKIGLAKVAALDQRYEAAFEILDEVLRADTTQIDAWHTKAKIAYSTGKLAEAKEAYEQVIVLGPKKVLSRIVADSELGLARTLIALGKDEDALEIVQRQVSTGLNHPGPKYLRAVLAYRAGDLEKARQDLQEVLAKFPNHQMSNLLLGAVHYAQRDYGQAEMYLSRFVSSAPAHTEGLKLLAATRLRLDKPEQALDTLSSKMDSSSNDIQLLSLIGEAALAGEDYEQAEKFFKRAVVVDPTASSIRAELAKVYVRSGQYSRALQELEELEVLDKKKALVLKVSTLLKKGDIEAARRTAREVVDASPDDPDAHTLLASVYAVSGSKKAARDEYIKASSLDGKYIPSRLLLGRLDLEEGKKRDAARYFDEVLALDSSNIPAMLGHAQIAEMERDYGAVKDWLEKARATDDTAYLPRFLLAKYYLGMKDAKSALAVAEEMAKLRPGDSDMFNVRGEALLALGRREEAVSVYREWVLEKPKNFVGHYKLGYVYFSGGEYERAIEALNTALAIDERYIPAQSLLALIYLSNNDIPRARERAENIKNIARESAAGFVLAGDVAMRENNYALAVKEYRQAFDREKTSSTLNRYHGALLRSGRTKSAIELSTNWLQQNPGDTIVRLSLAATYLDMDRKVDAEREYRQVLKTSDDNLVALNNLAWLLYEAGRLDEAMKYANVAYSRMPRSGQVADTLGWLMVNRGDVAGGLPLLEEAARLLKDNPEVKYHLAYALASSGRSAEARELLEQALSGDDDFNGRDEAEGLLGRLR